MTQLDELTDAFEDGVEQGKLEERARIVAMLLKMAGEHKLTFPGGYVSWPAEIASEALRDAAARIEAGETT